jgi:hypothetical protein
MVVTWRGRATVGAGSGLTAAALVSSLNPLLAAGASNELESRCASDPVAEWVYDRSSWTPLGWSCTVRHPDGTTDVIRPDLFSLLAGPRSAGA